MPSSSDRIRELLSASVLRPTVLDVEDASDECGSNFEVVVVSASFEGKKLLERHREVHAALGAEVGEIHALSLKTWTPEQYAAQKVEAGA
ncbi:bola-like protein 2 [Pavlovales sp. CCMP2436]|nr:bola-like protein 2 [Pavlovales sp. CCMP2436]|mmetsp:Transcript_1952/g.4884  ORF Transcript_1952/g.4884 Transcript_1952/m.4884 type:complete len:90 (-) Transcript_1952:239-508(-)|eukprot:CAMPEP_0179962010 /NCGR_PEP_ID=MMETSP0983-20121128/29999_1 /TAXON_ID=483367 /ORGANISM="non described non described, Strain CCMP 2436" /LENGTH=89 /DNA_ID=CAMNT_0021874505 /DNA_START=115 /DNA_END=384 /DNA_ORIENTATION=+